MSMKPRELNREQAKPRHEGMGGGRAVIRRQLRTVQGRQAWLQLGTFGLPPP